MRTLTHFYEPMMRVRFIVLLLTAALWTTSARAQTPTWTNAWSIEVVGAEVPTDIGRDAEGNIYVSGFARDFDQTDPRLAITQLLASWKPDGSQRWLRSMITAAPSTSAHMDVDADGNIYVAASFTGSSVIIDDGDAFTQFESRVPYNVLVLKYDAQGKLVWLLREGGNDSITVNGIAARPDGNVWIAGTFTGSVDLGQSHLSSRGGTDIFVGLIHDNGTFHMAVDAGGPANDVCHGLAQDPSGNVVMLGEFRGTATFGGRALTATGPSNFVLAHYDVDGVVSWAQGDGGPALALATTFTSTPLLLHVDRQGNIYVGIAYFNRIRVGDSTYRATSECDALIVKYRSNGTPVWMRSYSGEEQQLIQGIATGADGSVYIDGFSQALPRGQVFVAKLSAAGAPTWQVTNDLGDFASSVQGGPLSADARGNVYISGSFSGQTRFGERKLTSVGSSPTILSGNDIYVGVVGATSGLEAAEDRNTTDPGFTLSQQEGTLQVMPGSGSPAIIEAALYSVLGDRVASTADRNNGHAGAATRIDLTGIAHGSYLLVLHTTHGTTCRQIVISR